jgi:hypothetical protein
MAVRWAAVDLAKTQVRLAIEQRSGDFRVGRVASRFFCFRWPVTYDFDARPSNV